MRAVVARKRRMTTYSVVVDSGRRVILLDPIREVELQDGSTAIEDANGEQVSPSAIFIARGLTAEDLLP